MASMVYPCCFRRFNTPLSPGRCPAPTTKRVGASVMMAGIFSTHALLRLSSMASISPGSELQHGVQVLLFISGNQAFALVDTFLNVADGAVEEACLALQRLAVEQNVYL